MNNSIEKEIMDQNAALNRNWRANAQLKFIEKKKELFDKIAELEELELDFEQLENPQWFTSVDYIELIEKL